MFDSQVLDVLIGLVLMMSVVSLAASTIVETIAAATQRRAEDLKAVLDDLLFEKRATETPTAEDDPPRGSVADTAAYRMLRSPRLVKRGTADRDPSYVSSESFVDIATEVIDANGIAPDLLVRLETMIRRKGNDPAVIQAELQRYFEEAMERLTGAFKRWATAMLFAVGLVIAVAGNISPYHAARALWNDDATRDAVVEAAQNVGDEDDVEPGDLDSVAATVEQLEDLGIPIGWTDRAEHEWTDGGWLARIGVMLGWLGTAFLVTLGAPFWFDLLNRLISLRTSGKPPTKPEPETPAPEAAAAPRRQPAAPRRQPAASRRRPAGAAQKDIRSALGLH